MPCNADDGSEDFVSVKYGRYNWVQLLKQHTLQQQHDQVLSQLLRHRQHLQRANQAAAHALHV